MKINYPKAPIQEALIEVRPKFDSPPSLGSLSKIAEGLSKKYEKKEDLNHTRIEYKINKESNDEAVHTKEEKVGFLLKTADNKNITQITKDFISVNRVRPYTSGDDLLVKFKEVWDVFRKEITTNEFKRVALRFINVFETPLGENTDFYVNIPMEIEGPGDFEYYNLSKDLRFKSKKFNLYGHVKYNAKVSDDIEKVRHTFDITVFTPIITLENFQAFEKEYSKLRNFKNEIFEKNLKEKLKKTFKNE